MSKPPQNIKIYHITHVNNLANIVRDKVLWSDAKRLEMGCTCKLIGMSGIKKRRLEEIEVGCHPGTKVGEYVPFYFCPRSIMLYILHQANHPDLKYKGGQRPIIHLQIDLDKAITWAETKHIPWAFSDSNAGSFYADFYSSKEQLKKLNWQAINSTNFSSASVKEGKQAEFLMYGTFPWKLVEKIGVISTSVKEKAEKLMENMDNPPLVSVEPAWYY